MGQDVAGVLLAGGLSRRMGGGDKGLALLGGRSIVDRIIARLAPQVGPMMLNANGDPARFASTGLPVAADPIGGFAGPLAGILAGLDWAAERVPSCPWIVTVATDVPFLPRDLVFRLRAAVGAGADLACAASRGRAHPVIGLWPAALRHDLRRALGEGVRKVDLWTGRYRLATVAFPSDPVDPFLNVNTPEDLAAAEALV